MFVILMSDKMDPFYQIALSFPTIIFGILLIFCVLFWLVAILGMIDISSFDIDLPEADFSPDVGSEGASTPDAVAGIILKLGLNGVPLTVIITLISLIGWFTSFLVMYLGYDYIPDGPLSYLIGFILLIVIFYVSSFITAQIVKPLRPMFKKMEQNLEKLVMGQTAVVRSSRVDQNFGEAILEDGGAGLILKVRTSGDSQYKRGDKVVLIEQLKEKDVFRVVSEEEFKGI